MGVVDVGVVPVRGDFDNLKITFSTLLNIQKNNIYKNDIQRNNVYQNDIQQNNIYQNDIKHNEIIIIKK